VCSEIWSQFSLIKPQELFVKPASRFWTSPRCFWFSSLNLAQNVNYVPFHPRFTTSLVLQELWQLHLSNRFLKNFIRILKFKFGQPFKIWSLKKACRTPEQMLMGHLVSHGGQYFLSSTITSLLQVSTQRQTVQAFTLAQSMQIN